MLRCILPGGGGGLGLLGDGGLQAQLCDERAERRVAGGECRHAAGGRKVDLWGGRGGGMEHENNNIKRIAAVLLEKQWWYSGST